MARNILRGLDDRLFEERDSYRPGSGGVDHLLIDDLVTSFLEATNPNALDPWEMPSKLRGDIIFGQELDGQGLIDGVVRGLENSGHTRRRDADYLIGPIISALHTAGEQFFDVDYRNLDGVSHIGGRLGREDVSRPLTIHYHLPEEEWYSPRWVGKNSLYCTMRFSGRGAGMIQMAGTGSKDCTFIFEGVPAEIGMYGESCQYYLESVESVVGWKSDLDAYFSHKVTLKAQRRNRALALPKGFFEDGNALYIPENDGWRELRASG